MASRSGVNPLLGGSVALAAAVLANPHSNPSALTTLPSSLDLTLRWFRFNCHDLHRMMEFWMHVMKMQMDRQIDAGAKVRTCFQYPGDKVGIRFEYDRNAKITALPNRGTQPQNSPDGPPKRAPLPTCPLSPVTLLIYVDSVAEYLVRAREGSFIVWVDAHIVCDEPEVKAAVLLDPSGIKIRIMESEVYQLNKMRVSEEYLKNKCKG
jgi:hypothetical protein